VSPYYPAGTVFVAVVDPGVGTNRKGDSGEVQEGAVFCAADNGLISPVIDRDGLDSAREITNKSWMIGGRHLVDVPRAGHFFAGWGASGSGWELHAGRARSAATCPADTKDRHCDRQGA